MSLESNTSSTEESGMSVESARPIPQSASGPKIRNSQPWGRKDWLACFLLVAATALAYWPLRHAGFIWDDDTFLLDNPYLKQWRGLYYLWFTRSTPDYYPLTSSMLSVEWHLWGDHALGYHLVNLALHAGSAVLWWRILHRLKIPGAWLAAAIWALHPVNVESVAWIAERKNTLSMLFFALSLWCWVRFEDGGKSKWYGLALGAFVLALLSKTAAAPLPAVLLALAWWRRGRIGMRDVLRTIPFFVAAAALAYVTIRFQADRAIAHDVVRTDDFWSRLAVAGHAVWFYLRKALFPFPLLFVYPRWETDRHDVGAYLPLVLLVAVFVWFWRRRETWGRPWLFALAYYVLLLSPILGFINIYFMRYSLVADHWQYFAIIAPIALVAAGLHTSAKGFWKKSLTTGYACYGALLIGLGALTWNQCEMYEGSEKLWRVTLEKNPDCPLGQNNLGELLLRQEKMDEATTRFERALQTDPDYLPALVNLGRAYADQGRLGDAIGACQKAVELDPENGEARNNLGTALLSAGRMDEGVAQFHEAIKLMPKHPGPRFNLGLAFKRMGRLDEAIEQFQAAAKIQPGNAQAYFETGDIYRRERKPKEAAAQYEKAVELDANNLEALNSLAMLLATSSDASARNGAKAVEYAERLERLDGGKNPILLSTLAAAYAEAGKFPEAVKAQERALQVPGVGIHVKFNETLQSRLKMYQAGTPLHEPEPPH
ncbi:MAG TPA: tetratricopeptide repeat protein [Chthoniobacteraceae bacterium]